MKKTIFALLLTLSNSLCFSQIQRNFLGCNLGVTTKSEAVLKFTQKKFNVMEGKNDVEIVGKILFDNVQYNSAIFVFRNNKFKSVTFFKSHITNKSIRYNLVGKYKKYLQNKADDEYLDFSDGRTIINLECDDPTEGLILTYSDKELSEK